LETTLSRDELIKKMDDAGVAQICLSAWHRPGQVVFSNEEVAQYTQAYLDRIFGLASVNLLDPVSAVRELKHFAAKYGFKGLRIVPWLWNLPPTDAHYWPLYVKCIELDIPFIT
jgi:predicted TIM-barrel fold metal-dependent hydrolase